jgi:cytochrome c oxidase subunit 2
MRHAVIFVRSLLSAVRRTGLRSVALAAPLSAGVYLALAQSASAACCTLKTGGSPNATSIATLYDIVFGLSVVVFLAVVGFILYSVWRFRAHKNPVALQVHGNTRLELSLTLSAAMILVVIAAVTFIKLPSIVNPPNSNASASSVLSASLTAPQPPSGNKLTVCVTARQFIPAGVTVDLLIQSSDVIHAWWIPALGGKVDAVPGFTTYTWFKALHAKELYHGQCAQLCGREHAYMTALVKVVTPKQYTAWLAQQSSAIGQQNNQVAQIRQYLTKQGILTSSGNF